MGMDAQLKRFRQRHAVLWKQVSELRQTDGGGAAAPEEENAQLPQPERRKAANIAAAAAILAILTRPGSRSFVAHIRNHGQGAQAWLPVARRLANLHNYVLFSTARAGGTRYVGLFGCWFAIPGWPRLPLPGTPLQDIHGLVLVYAAIFMAWRYEQCVPFLSRHFLLSSEAHTRRRPWTLLGACFSHVSVPHLVHNAVALLQQAPILQAMLGRQHFLAFYCLTGIIGNVGSLWLRRYQRPSQRRVSSLGASGSLYAMSAALATVQPWRQYVLTSGIRLNAVQLLFAHLGADLLFRGNEGIDTAAHLCGAAAGALWMTLMWP